MAEALKQSPIKYIDTEIPYAHIDMVITKPHISYHHHLYYHGGFKKLAQAFSNYKSNSFVVFTSCFCASRLLFFIYLFIPLSVALLCVYYFVLLLGCPTAN